MKITKALDAVFESYNRGDYNKAEKLCKKILLKKHNNVDSLHLLGMIYFQRGEHDLAIQYIQRTLQIDPSFSEAYNNLGNIYQDIKQLDEAIFCYQKATHLNPNLAKTYYNLGIALQDKNRLDEAIESYQRALHRNFVNYGIFNNLGLAFQQKGKVDEAIKCYQKVLDLNPSFTDAHYNLGNALKEKGNVDEAIACYNRALQLNPAFSDAYNNLGSVYRDKGQFDEAITCYKKALLHNPHFAEAYYNLGNVFIEQQKIDEAMTAYDKAILLNPNFMLAHWAKCIEQLPALYSQPADIQSTREHYHQDLVKLRDFISLKIPQDIQAQAEAVGSVQPFSLAYQGLNNRDLQHLYGNLVCNIMSLRYPQFSQRLEISAYATVEPLRIGIVSKFFYWHSVWKIPLSGWIKNTDRRRFHLYGYYTGRTKDHVTETARKCCYRFVEDISSFEKLCETMRNDNLHVLIYPEIGMDPTTLRLAALRLAPTQCASLGHPDTTGLPTIDYYLSSELMEPPDADEHYTEKLIRLPNLGFYYSPFDITSQKESRETFGLRPDSIIYLCCHALFTHLPQYDEIYPRIAQEIPHCQFVFISNYRRSVTEQFHERIISAFQRFGFNDDGYIAILPRLTQEQYHDVNSVGDVFLDTIGWSANNSTFEAIACNTPIVTFPGNLMRQRHCAAILTMMGVTDTIASSIEEYISYAVRLGKDTEWRHHIAQKISEHKHLIYNDKTCIHALEDFLEKIIKEKTEQLQHD